MKIVRERPSQRLHHRVTAPLWVVWRDQPVRTADWSLSGLRLEDVETDGLSTGDHVDLDLSLPFQGFDIRFGAGAEVVRLGETMVAFRLTRLGERERGLMAHFLEELVRGSMVDIEDTIQRIDLPVTPVATRPDPNPSGAIPVRRWPIRAIVMSILYLTLGTALLLYAGFLAYANLFKLEIESAVVAAPIEVLEAHGDGRIVLADVEPGDWIEAGQTLGRLADSTLEHRLDLAAIAVERARARRNHAAHMLDAVSVATSDRNIVAGNNRERTAAVIAALETRLQIARSQHDRVGRLYRQGWATLGDVEEAEDAVAAVEAELTVHRIDLGEYDETATVTNAEGLFDAIRMEQEHAQLSADLGLAEEELALTERELAALQAHQQRLDLIAPFDGRVVEISQPAGTSVLRGEPILVLERNEARTVEAFLDQDQILSIGLGDEAKVYLPGLDLVIAARVTRIDRTSGFVDEQEERYSWRGPQDRTAHVTLEFLDPSPSADIAAGIPAIVIFDRRSDDAVMAGVIASLDRGPVHSDP